MNCPVTCANASLYCEALSRGSPATLNECSLQNSNIFFSCSCNGLTSNLISNESNCAGLFFEESPEQSVCTPMTGGCPDANCSNSTFFDGTCQNLNCTPTASGVTLWQCDSCGALFSVNTTNNACSKQFQPPSSWCDSNTFCEGHGCCRLNDSLQPVCTCDSFWTGSSCGECAAGFSGEGCESRLIVDTQVIPAIGASAMALPILAASFIVSLLLIIRRQWISDEQLYDVTKYSLGLPQLSQKRIPPRPKGSRGNVNCLALHREDVIVRGQGTAIF